MPEGTGLTHAGQALKDFNRSLELESNAVSFAGRGAALRGLGRLAEAELKGSTWIGAGDGGLQHRGAPGALQRAGLDGARPRPTGPREGQRGCAGVDLVVAVGCAWL